MKISTYCKAMTFTLACAGAVTAYTPEAHALKADYTQLTAPTDSITPYHYCTSLNTEWACSDGVQEIVCNSNGFCYIIWGIASDL